MNKMKSIFLTLGFLILYLSPMQLFAQAKLTLDFTKQGAAVSPMLYGLMTEEINHAYDGGLYGELIHNRVFKDSMESIPNWSLVNNETGKAAMVLDYEHGLNKILNVSLKLTVESNGEKVGIANTGFWGIPVKPQTTYRCSFYAKSSNNTGSPLTVAIESNDGKVMYAQAQITGITGEWKEYTTTLITAKDVEITDKARFVITTKTSGTYWFDLVSLFPPTFNNRPNGNRPDIMQTLIDMKPSFLRFPGGNYLEGDKFSTRFDWKKTLGPLTQRPGHPAPWRYRSSDGMGLLEFLEWCEDIHVEPVLGVFAGYVLKEDYIVDEPFLKPFIEDALDEIEYITGDKNTKWGAIRAANGHPEPFKLNYIEIGNEDDYDLSGSYESRFKQFYTAIRARHPNIQLISTIDKSGLSKETPPDIVDEHYYLSASEMQKNANRFDSYDRKGPKIFVGEWASMEGRPTNNFNAALGDAAFMTGMERNADIIEMAAYAPLFSNVNKGATQWTPDLIGYNALSVYGSPSYYAQKMFNTYLGNELVSVAGENIPTQMQKINRRDSLDAVQPKMLPTLFYVATKNSKTGTVYLKVVNTSEKMQTVNIDFKGKLKVMQTGLSVTLKSDDPMNTNSITDPEKIVPVKEAVKKIKKDFNYTFPAYSVSVLQVETKE
jgi:alpha-N-arabinofuranosidase